jgi:hypothetical protein
MAIDIFVIYASMEKQISCDAYNLYPICGQDAPIAQRALLWGIVCSTGGTPRTWAGPKPTPPSSLRTATSLRTTII